MQNLIDINNFNGQVFHNEELSKHTSYKIGGPCKCFVEVNDAFALKLILNLCKQNNFDWFIIGGGSNLLVSDEGFDGIIIKLAGDFASIKIDDENFCKCGAAVSTAKLHNFYLDNNLEGAEFLAGIPGSIGGAIKMNAGTKDVGISSILQEITLIDNSLEIKTIAAELIDWQYRNSSIKNDEIILSAKFKFNKVSDAKIDEIKSKISQMNERRRESQPIGMPSCGSVFKNPVGNSAGKLIEEAGLKGKEIGGAMISDVHANFIVNINCASAQDVVSLIQLAQKEVFEKFSVKLQTELKFLGFDKQCSLF